MQHSIVSHIVVVAAIHIARRCAGNALCRNHKLRIWKELYDNSYTVLYYTVSLLNVFSIFVSHLIIVQRHVDHIVACQEARPTIVSEL
jgi:hypothetical protein